ncbi:methyltransferase domain-containing protein [Halorarum halobium]|uniref:methyltransferase domain-containing protein n=1 Tax=Halorarum halobium TaxID=3075121 RepID=UPI0028AC2873|nr:methyltransferase domain-containing protein [Halobaculum sp. XH14]
MPTRERIGPGTASGLGTASLLALRAARETGVLAALLDRAGTPEAVAEETDVTERSAERMVSILADLGFIERVGDEYEPTNRALGLLAKRDVASIGAVPDALDTVDALASLPGTMETGVPPESPPDGLRNRLGAHAATDEAVVRAGVTAAVRASPDAERVVDLRGASGVYAAEFAARGLDATMVDSPAVAEAVEPRYRSGDVTVHAGRPRDLVERADGSGPFDLAFAAGLASRMDAPEVRALFEAAADLLGADGTLVLVDVLADGSEAAVAADVLGLASGHGGAHDPAEYREWLREAGLADVRIDPVPGTGRRAVVARKRAVE